MTVSFEELDRAPAADYLPETTGNTDIDRTWLERAYASIEREEYLPVTRDSEIVMGNRAQGFGAVFTTEDVTIAPRNKPSETWGWKWRTVSFGRRSAECALSPVPPTQNGNRVEYRRGSVIEWYLNSKKGIEQGFTIDSPPAGTAVVHITGGKACRFRYGDRPPWMSTGKGTAM